MGSQSPGRRVYKRLIQPGLRSLIYVCFVGVQLFFRLLGPTLGRHLGRAIGWSAGKLLPYERRITMENLRRAFPDQEEASLKKIRTEMFVHLGESAVELIFPKKILSGNIQAKGLEAVEAALKEGNGVIIVGGHIGNWEIMTAATALHNFPITVIAKRIYDDRLDAWMRGWRDNYGIETVVRDQPDTIKRILKALKEGHMLGILIDQDTDVPSVWVPFFGQPTKTPIGAARLAQPGIPCFVATGRRAGPWQHEVEFLPVVCEEGEDLTAKLSLMLEQQIRAYPAQWVWLHRRWKTPPPE